MCKKTGLNPHIARLCSLATNFRSNKTFTFANLAAPNIPLDKENGGSCSNGLTVCHKVFLK